MRDHESRLQTGIASQKRRQPFALIGIHHSIDPPFTDRHQVGHSNTGIIESQGQGSAMEIAARNHVSTFSENKRIIGGGSGFDLKTCSQ